MTPPIESFENEELNKIIAEVSRWFKTMTKLPLLNCSWLEASKRKPSLLFENLNGSVSSLWSDEMTEEKWLSVAMSMPT